MIRQIFDPAVLRLFRIPTVAQTPRLGYPLLALLVAALLLPGCKASISDKSIKRIDVTVAAKAVDSKAVFVDVRPAEDFAAGHIPGALNIRLADIPDDGPVPALRSKKRIIVYGQNPGSSVAMAFVKQLLSSRHYDRVEWFEGGFDAWRAAGGTVQRGY
jgi:rhodanese-related sulfurtransferase